jgi:hypothetical protein
MKTIILVPIKFLRAIFLLPLVVIAIPFFWFITLDGPSLEDIKDTLWPEDPS